MKAFAQGFLSFNAASPTPFHVCKNVGTSLEANGFTKIYEEDNWVNTVKPGGKYFFTRNGSSLCAFVVGAKYKSGNGFKLMGAHTDSPVLKVKPVSKREGYGVELVGVETYGGGLWHTWFDRDLGVAGRVMIKKNGGETFAQQLVHINRPILRIATLCIHLQTTAERAGFAPNVEDHLVPILSSLSEELSGAADNTSDYMTRHSPKLLTLLGQQLGCDPADIVDFELTLCPTEAPVLGGAAEEFIFAPRMDNQLHCYVGSNSFISVANENDSSEEGILLISLFDHEEVGSASNEGAGSPLIRDTMERLVTLRYNSEVLAGAQVASSLDEAIKTSIAKSILFSTDCTHAIHPNYPEKHESKHQNKMGMGPCVSTNTNQKFVTNGVTGFFVRQLARQTKVGYYDDGASGFTEIPIQEFNGRNDQASGSTIGPHLASGVGLRTVDVGISHISMHSIREQCATKDLWSAFYLFRAFLKDGLKLDARLSSADQM